MNSVTAEVVAVEAELASLTSSVASTDELVGSQVMTSFVTSTTAAQSITQAGGTNAIGIFTAPFDLEITKFSATWHYHSYAQNDTNYFRLRLYRRRAGTAVVIVTKENRTTPNGGEAVTALTPWTFDGQTWDPTNSQLQANDVLEVGVLFVGTFTVNAPVQFTWKYRPL